MQVTAEQHAGTGDEVTFIVPPSRAVWIAPGARHAVHVLEDAQFRTLYIDACVTPPGWNRCRVIVVSPLLRELVHALDAPAGARLPKAREERLTGLVVDEIAHADIQALGVPLPHAQAGDKRLRALCEAVLRAPTQRAQRWRNGRWTSARANAPWRDCSARNWAPATSNGASRRSWRTRCRCWRAACR